MTPTTEESVLIADIRAALAAAAEPVRPVSMVLPAPAPRSRSARRAVIALVAAVVVLLTGITAALLLVPRHDVRTATTITRSGNVVDVGGIRFPLPAGWTAAVTGHTTTDVTVCVAVTPTPTCDGVILAAAIPDQWGAVHPVGGDAWLFDRSCRGRESPLIMALDGGPGTTVAGRPARYLFSSCSGGDDYGRLWQLSDGSLSVYAPPGPGADEATTIVAGLDLSAWSHRAGQPVMEWTSSSSSG